LATTFLKYLFNVEFKNNHFHCFNNILISFNLISNNNNFSTKISSSNQNSTSILIVFLVFVVCLFIVVGILSYFEGHRRRKLRYEYEKRHSNVKSQFGYNTGYPKIMTPVIHIHKRAYFVLKSNDIDLILLWLYETSEVRSSTLISFFDLLLFAEKVSENGKMVVP